ncbi:uncharacterized skeletal organic matrix protein 7-like [Clytia hemisphaerica]|uniref:Uncharacterized protein n=1 Tax=Clytia hemisphaerica TaxID=252671 RepID=A0A7M5XL44_9CNID
MKMAATMKFIVILGLVSTAQSFLEPSCNRDVSWTVQNCAGYSEIGSVLRLQGSPTGSGVTPCFAVPKNQVDKPAKLYIMKMKFKNIQAWQGINSGHIGLIFNMKDNSNYDFLYARLHSPTVQYGFVQNGTPTFVSNLNLSGNRSGAIPHSFQIDVLKDKSVKVYYDNALVGTFTAKFSTLAAGGVLTWNHYNNIIEFGNFQLIA